MINSFKDSTRAPSPWLPKMKPKAGGKMRLFCFPYAGGTTHIYSNWESLLPPTIEVCPVELPGRGARISEPAARSILSLVRPMATALLPYMDKPFAFFGHSMGALISFELARELRRAHGLQPARMFISASLSPQQSRSEKKMSYNLPEPEFIEELRRLNGTPVEVLEHPELMQLVIPLLRADFEACQTYRYTPEPPLDCPLTVFGGLQDKDISRSELAEWAGQTTSRCVVRMLSGDHFFVNTAHAMILRMLAEELHADAR